MRTALFCVATSASGAYVWPMAPDTTPGHSLALIAAVLTGSACLLGWDFIAKLQRVAAYRRTILRLRVDGHFEEADRLGRALEANSTFKRDDFLDAELAKAWEVIIAGRAVRPTSSTGPSKS